MQGHSLPISVIQGDQLEARDLDQIRILRRMDGNYYPGEDPGAVATDDHDGHAVHVVARLGSEIVAAARLCQHSSWLEIPDWALFPESGWPYNDGPGIAALSRLVVSPMLRNSDVAAKIDEERLYQADKMGVRIISARGTPHRSRYLLSRGFQTTAVAKGGEIMVKVCGAWRSREISLAG